MENVQVYEAALGAFIGAAVGNAAGTLLDLYCRIPEEQVEAALRWQSSNGSRRAPGQVACEIEMALVIGQALAQHPPGILPLADLIAGYAQWSRSNPSGHGRTLQEAMRLMRKHQKDPDLLLAAVADPQQNSRCTSQSNGSIIRVVPLALWGHQLPPETLAELARRESAVSHPSPECADAVAAYVIALAHLVRHPGDGPGALRAATTWADGNVCATVKEWLHEAIAMEAASEGCVNNIEWVRWSFQQAFMHLALGTGYEAGIRATLAAGGDPCSNTAVVGGMLGALHGARAVPQHLQDVVLKCRVGSRGWERPDFLQTGLIPGLTQQLVERARGS